MSDGQIIYEVRADDSKLDRDLDQSNQKVESKSGKFAAAAGVVGKAAAGAALAVGSAAVAASGAAIKFGSDFESSMAAASTLFGDVSVNTDLLNEKMLALSDSSGVAASELGGSLYNALSAGIPASEDMSEAVEFLEKSTRLAKAGFTDVDTAMSATVKTMNAYGLGVEEADRVQKILMQTQNNGITTVGELGSVLSNVTPTAAAMGVEFEQVGAAISSMTAAGTPAAQATTQLNSLFAELGKEGTKAQIAMLEAAEGTEHAGKSFQEMMDEGVPLNEVLDMMGDYAEDNGVGMLDMFSSIEAGKGALAISGSNAEGFTKNLKAMSTEADVVGDAFDKVSDTSAEKFNKIVNQLKNSAIDLFFQLEPLISEALPLLQEMFEMLLPPLMELASQIMPYIVDLFKELLPPLMELAEALMPVIIQLFSDFLPPIIELAKNLMPILIKLFNTLLPPIMELITQLLPPLLELFDALTPILDIIIDLLGPILDLFLSLAKPIIDLISGAVTPLINVLARLMKIALEPLQNRILILKETFSAVFQSISGFIIEQTQRWIKIFNGFIDFFKNIFAGNWSAAWENVKDIFSNIWEGIKAGFKAPINVIIDGINGFTGGLSKIKIPDWVPGVGGKGFNIGQIPRLRVGMDYVPSDDFPALLHRGEAVLTAEEAAVYRSLGSRLSNMSGSMSGPSMNVIVDFDYDRIATAMAKIQMKIIMDNRELARALDNMGVIRR